MSFKNIGTLEFKSDGTKTDDFTWSATDDKLIVEGEKWDVTTKKKKEMVLESSTSMMNGTIERKLSLGK